jgi:hypothetical protein
MKRVNDELPGAVLYTVRTPLAGRALSEMIRRDIRSEIRYYCAHLDEEALIISNAVFPGANAKNSIKFLTEFKKLMESGYVGGMSTRRPKQKVPKGESWSLATISEEIMPEYNGCMTDYEIGRLLIKYDETKQINRITRAGAELMRKIRSGELTQNIGNIHDNA